jgi:type I restriction-modification system DNA methylase subunit
MMSKYDNLDARTGLEQEITVDLKRALTKRGFEIRHNSKTEFHSPAGFSDIEMWDDTTHINIEVTKRVKSNQDGEWQSFKDHFEKSKKENANKNCYVWFISPETYYRTLNSIKDWNFAHQNSKDEKMLPICFSTFEIFINKLIETPNDQYTKSQILTLFENFVEFNDDESILRHFFIKLFNSDLALQEKIEIEEEERHQKVVEELISGFKQLEQKMRDKGIATTEKATRNVIYLVFIKLYEEKKEKEEGKRNRFTLQSFKDYQSNIRDDSRAIHQLFNDIKKDAELQACRLFTDEDLLSERINDEFVIEHFIKEFEEYIFYTSKVDGLGAAYEVLGQLSGKDVKLGQFFTPENVVKFMVRLAELHPEDTIYDPACGTARFLTNSMDDLENKIKGTRDEKSKLKKLKTTQLYGTDYDPTVAKLAKMNMYIHGDGKTNINDEDGLLQFDKDDKFDVILTNPPLGDLDYSSSRYNAEFRETRMEVVPKNNLTIKSLKKVDDDILLNKTRLSAETSKNKIKRIVTRIEELERKKADLEYKIRHNDCEYETSGALLKGGALFLNACKYYLKDVRNSDEKIEWRGGKILIILDEGILNTDDYKDVREFIKKNFFIKAVISLTKDTFVPVSKTTTKTSIIYAIKKPDTDVIQREPIFFAHVEKVGLNTKKKGCENHLFGSGNDILTKFFDFKNAVLSSYEGSSFKREKFEQSFTPGTLS